MKEYIAINLDDFHSNQIEATTHCKMIFIGAKNIEKAKEHIKRWHSGTAFSIIPGKSLNKHIVYNESEGNIK